MFYMEKCYKNFFGRIFFRYPYRSNDTKIHLDVALMLPVSLLAELDWSFLPTAFL